jgi:hypothetical protein
VSSSSLFKNVEDVVLTTSTFTFFIDYITPFPDFLAKIIAFITVAIRQSVHPTRVYIMTFLEVEGALHVKAVIIIAT